MAIVADGGAQAAERSNRSIGDDITQGAVAFLLADAVALAQAFDFDGDVTHR